MRDHENAAGTDWWVRHALPRVLTSLEARHGRPATTEELADRLAQLPDIWGDAAARQPRAAAPVELGEPDHAERIRAAFVRGLEERRRSRS